MSLVPVPSDVCPLVLLPGMMLDYALWQRMLPQLATLGPLIYGDLSRDDNIDDMARRVLADVPARFILIGFSLGGFVARAIMRLAPERVAALILIATSVRPDSDTTLALKQQIAQAVADRPGRFRGVGKKAIALSLSQAHENDQGLHRAISEMSVRMGALAYQRQLLLRRPDDRAELGHYHCPTLVIAARQDRMRSLDEAQELAAAIPGAQCRIIEGSGHMIPLENPAALYAVLHDWLVSLRVNPGP